MFGGSMIVNFFWHGDDFQFLNRLSILSHLVAGHGVKVWLSGQTPESKYWIDDNEGVEIVDAHTIVDDSFLQRGGNVRTLSDLWQFTFLYECGGLYCDTDLIALKAFPNMEWIISRDSEDEEGMFAIGIIKAPKGHLIFKECIANWKPGWNNVNVFTNACKRYGLGLTHPKEVFHPFSCGQNSQNLKTRGIPILLNDGDVFPNSFSIHYFGNMTHRLHIDESWLLRYPNSILTKLCKRVFSRFPYAKDKK